MEAVLEEGVAEKTPVVTETFGDFTKEVEDHYNQTKGRGQIVTVSKISTASYRVTIWKDNGFGMRDIQEPMIKSIFVKAYRLGSNFIVEEAKRQ